MKKKFDNFRMGKYQAPSKSFKSVERVNIEVVAGGWNKLFEDTRLKRVERFER